jgi:subtilisin family serine protease
MEFQNFLKFVGRYNFIKNSEKKMNKNKLCLLMISTLFSFGLYAESSKLGSKIIIEKSLNKLKIYKQESDAKHLNKTRKVNNFLKNSNLQKKLFTTKNKMEIMDIDNTGMPIFFSTFNTDSRSTIGANRIQKTELSDFHIDIAGTDYKLDGSKQNLFIWDGGMVNKDHQAFNGRVSIANPLHSSEYDSGWDHATHVAGTMAASSFIGANFLSNKDLIGMAPAAKIYSYDWDNALSEMSNVSRRARGNSIASNHSWGESAGWIWTQFPQNSSDSNWIWLGNQNIDMDEDWRFGAYTEAAANLDTIAIEGYWHTIVKSAGNSTEDRFYPSSSGYYTINPMTQEALWHSVACVNTDGNNLEQCAHVPRPNGLTESGYFDTLPPDSTAKNILTVGAIDPLPYGYYNSVEVQQTYYSSVGPTDDGRIKPDIVANGTHVLSTTYKNLNTEDGTPKDSEISYDYFDGTSMAAPSVTGSIALLQQMYEQLNENWRDDPLTAIDIKALLIHTADRKLGTGPNYHTGWGVANFYTSAKVLASHYKNITFGGFVSKTHYIWKALIQEGLRQEKRITIEKDGNLKVTIYWHDEPGQIQAPELNSRDKHLVVNLDLIIQEIDNNGNVLQTWNPWKLDPNHPERPAERGINNTDNVEQVLVRNVKKGHKYRILVTNHSNFTDRFSVLHPLGKNVWPFTAIVSYPQGSWD